MQFPAPPCAGLADASHALASHVAAIKLPVLLQLDAPDTLYPLLHVGWHVEPDAREEVQSPTTPLLGAVDASHAFASHVAAIKLPTLQLDAPDTLYPLLHVGWHVEPDAKEEVQSPTAPLLGAVDASHGFGLQLAAVKFPKLQLDAPNTAYPISQVG